LGVSLLILPGIARGWTKPWWIVRVRRDEIVLRVRSYLNANLDDEPTVVRIPRREIERLRFVAAERVLPGEQHEADERSSVEWLELTLIDVDTLALQRMLTRERTPARRGRGKFGVYPVQSQGARTLRVMWSGPTLCLRPSTRRVASRLRVLEYPARGRARFQEARLAQREPERARQPGHRARALGRPVRRAAPVARTAADEPDAGETRARTAPQLGLSAPESAASRRRDRYPAPRGASVRAAIFAHPETSDVDASSCWSGAFPFVVRRRRRRAAQDDVLTAQDVARLRNATSAVISPDGKTIAYTLAVPRKPLVDEDGASWSELHVVDVASGASRPFVTGKVNVSALEWLPDGSALAFLAKRGDDKNAALYVIALEGGEARKAASLGDAITAFDIAKDGAARRAGRDGRRERGAQEAEGQGLRRRRSTRRTSARPTVWTTSCSTRPKPSASRSRATSTKRCGAPVDDRIAIKVAPTALVDDSYMRTRIRVIDSQDGHALARDRQPGQARILRVEPGRQDIAMIAAADIHDPTDGRLMTAPASGGAPAELLPGLEANAEALVVAEPGRACVRLQPRCLTSFEKIKTGDKPKVLVATGGPILTSVTLSSDGLHAAFVASAPTHASEVFTMSHGDAGPRKLTDSNAWLANERLAPQEIVQFKARDGSRSRACSCGSARREEGPALSARAVRPRRARGAPSERLAHQLRRSGADARRARLRGDAHQLPRLDRARLAFAKLEPGRSGRQGVRRLDRRGRSPRVDRLGRQGQGRGHGRLLRRLRDRWLSTRYSDRIAAGVMFVGISDKVSKVGTTDIPDEEYYVHALHRPWEDWQKMLERSPVYYGGQCKTPL
jgi:dipeptidyl aminopeptidase/acylaminoacyl peptidase